MGGESGESTEVDVVTRESLIDRVSGTKLTERNRELIPETVKVKNIIERSVRLGLTRNEND